MSTIDKFSDSPLTYDGRPDQRSSAPTRSVNDEETSMQITLLSDTGNITSITLPFVSEGKYRFENCSRQDIRNLIYIEAKGGKWHVCCNAPISFISSDGSSVCDIPLCDRLLIPVENVGGDCVLYVENIGKDSSVFRKYMLTRSGSVSIGRSDGNDIVYPNSLVSRRHALLNKTDGGWYIQDSNSSNGTFVNNRRISRSSLHTGDVVYILGLRLIIGPNFIAINDGDNRAYVRSSILKPIDSDLSVGDEPPKGSVGENALFNRLPRHRTALAHTEITIEAPPLSMNSNKIPLLLRMGGSMAMGGISALSGHYTSLIVSVLFPLLNQKYSDKEKKEYEALRTEKYTAYLNGKRKEISDEVNAEQSVLNQNYPELEKVLKYPKTKTQLWERRKIDDDFLSVRLGSGRIPLIAEIDYPKQRFDMNEDELETQMYSLAETPVTLENVPITASLVENPVIGVTGDKSDRLELAHRLIMQTAILHSYDEVKFIFLLEPDDLAELEYIKYLPHTWDDQRTVRFIATSPSEAYQIGEYLKSEVEDDITGNRKLKDIMKMRPYYVIFAMSKRIFDGLEILKEIMQKEDEENCGVSVVALFDDLPKECSLLFNAVCGGKSEITYLNQPERSSETFSLDPVNWAAASESMRILANTDLKIVTQAYSLPKTLTFLEMFGAGRLEHLNPLKRWRDNNPVKSLAAPIGIATDGSTFYLDLHQKFQGPHGLVAGMTGSGKSEFLLTYILSMAVNFHPDEVAFVLIDYKGGGLAGAFDDPAHGVHLPHLIGTITNLDGSTIQRSIMSIQSELLRRQRIFNEVKNITDEGTMDIYKYQRLYRNGAVSEPIPHLFIISDEFAELKQQQPEFMDNLISIARIGRSLGVHLILATQKPSGVVNDQIRSNTKFRVCLKVQDKSDSIDMLQRPEAAELKDTGRFYLQVGYNELFALGQSAWSGADYYPEDEVVVQLDDSVQFIDAVGSGLLEAKPKTTRGASCGTQLVSAVKMLSDIAEENGIKCRPLWQPALPKKIELEKISTEKYNKQNAVVCADLGLLDDPSNQKQFTLNFDFSHCRNLLIVGDQGSGKTTLIQSILYSLTSDYSPEELNYYILDYSSRMFKVFSNLPHCGGVFFEEDTSRLESLFKLISSIVTERKRLFTALEVDSFDAACAVQKLPLILVVIDNYSAFASTKLGEALSGMLYTCVKNYTNYGIKFVVSCNRLNEMPMRTKQEFVDRICLHVKDKYDFGDVLGCKVQYVPGETPGRGLYEYEGLPLEFQAAMFKPEEDSARRIKLLKMFADNIANAYVGSSSALRLPTLSETQTYEEFSQQFDEARFPLGYSLKDAKPVALPFRQFSSMSLYFGNPAGISPIWQNFIYTAKTAKMQILALKRRFGSIFSDGILPDDSSVFECSSESVTDLWKKLFDIVVERKDLLVNYCAENHLDAKRSDIYAATFDYMSVSTKPTLLLIESFADLSAAADSDAQKVLCKIFGLCRQYNIYVLGGFYAADSFSTRGNALYSSYNTDNLAMMFGGRCDIQPFGISDRRLSQIKDIQPYNKCVMLYREQLYDLIMPCGELTEETQCADDMDIF